ncbi:fluoride efflux transporter FluC [Nonomuraea jiangxiensis]|uniref:Fluoride-specific ion channel FluC n=1 Tax=Nonomuraea jiangxiensis TaxID=633440 RepID=A0A1G9BEW7_9ACTN|nr:CrcB family protein [Nonomuraea jiangxiensis]SDK37395.1 CrcB protein [Nonomuraea jiangxiensis]
MHEPVTPVDSDVDVHVPGMREELRPHAWPVLAAISAGGVLGALARYGISSSLPHGPTGFPWSTFLVNVSGCLLIGVLMTLVDQVWTGRRLLRPFWGVGVLGGYTTFSTYILDIHQAMRAGAPGVALAYLAATLVAALPAVWAGTTITRQALALARRRSERGRQR